MSEIVPFDFEGNPIRWVVDLDGVPWAVAGDVCAALGLVDVSRAVSRLDDADTRTTRIRSGSQDRQVIIINESGLYDLVLDSRKPEARRFRRWITSEVLPSIRQTGSYVATPRSFAEALELAAAQQRAIETGNAKIAELEPAAEQFHRWQESEDTVYVVEWAKSIGLTEHEAYEALRECGVLFKQRHHDRNYLGTEFNLPKRGWEKYFEIIDEYKPAPRRWAKVPKITAEGQVVLAELLLEHGRIAP